MICGPGRCRVARKRTADRPPTPQRRGFRAYTGRATARTVKLLPDGTVFHARAAQKIRRREQGMSTPPPNSSRSELRGRDPALWLRDALVTGGARNIRHRGAHRFCGRSTCVAVYSM